MQIDIQEAETSFVSLIDRAAAGEEIVIAKAGQPVARLVGLFARRKKRRSGRGRREIEIARSFDDPLPGELARGFGS
ncbi:MAG: type II toxin-antitoxin system prevent-host-death family antitoxin [Myxococcota bacterium]